MSDACDILVSLNHILVEASGGVASFCGVGLDLMPIMCTVLYSNSMLSGITRDYCNEYKRQLSVTDLIRPNSPSIFTPRFVTVCGSHWRI